MITKKMVKKLARTGAIQLPTRYAPPSIECFFSATENRTQYGTIYMWTERIFGLYPQLEDLAGTILDLAGYEVSFAPKLRVTANTKNVGDRGWHRDFMYTEDAIPGFSFLYAKQKEPYFGHIYNTIVTGGRGDEVDDEQKQSFSYPDGPVVICQSGFDTTEQDASELGPTWHRGLRISSADFRAIDILNPTRTDNSVSEPSLVA